MGWAVVSSSVISHKVIEKTVIILLIHLSLLRTSKKSILFPLHQKEVGHEVI